MQLYKLTKRVSPKKIVYYCIIINLSWVRTFFITKSRYVPQRVSIKQGKLIRNFDIMKSIKFSVTDQSCNTLLEKFWRISLYVTDVAIAKLYVT